MLSKINNCLLKLIMFCLVGIYSAPTWTETNQVETASVESEQAIIEQDNELLTETEALVEDLEAKSKEAQEKLVLFRKSTGEERSMLGTQVLDFEVEVRKSLDKLISNIDTINEQGVDTDKYLSVAKAITKKQSDSIIKEIKLISSLLDDLEQAREETEPADLFLLEQRISQGQSIIDQLLKALLENTERMKLVGLDASKYLENLKNELKKYATNLSTLVKLTTEKITRLNVEYFRLVRCLCHD